jgi:putative heme-binding domain-containing protein
MHETLAQRRIKSVATFLLHAAVVFATSQSRAADEPPSSVGPLLKLYQSGRLAPERQPAVVEMICNRGNTHDLRVVFDRVLTSEGMARPLRLQAMNWLAEAAQTRKVKPAGDLGALAELVRSDDPPLRLAAVRLAAMLQVGGASAALREIALDTRASPNLQQAAITALTSIGDAENQGTLLSLASKGPTTEIRMQAVAAVAVFDVAQASRAAAAVLAGASADDVPDLLLDAFLGRKEGSTLLAQALKQNRLSADVAKRALRYMYSVGRSDAELSAVLSEAAGVIADPPPPTQEEVATLVREVIEKGDAVRGERIFRRADLSCMRCHSVSRAGGQVGPDLSAVGGSSPLDYIVNSILNPSLAVKEQFVTRMFETVDGKVLTGIVIDRDESRVRIRDAQGKTLTIPTADIEEEVEGKSMMPTGLTKFLTRSELLDLIRFISELGKPGDYAVRADFTIQRWRVLARPPQELITEVPHLEHIRQHVLNSPAEAWGSAYATVRGLLPLSELRSAGRPTVVILRGELQVNDAGLVAFRVDSTEATQVWIDEVAFESQKHFELELKPGRHLVIVRVAISGREAPALKVELTRPAGSTAQFEVIGGS